MTSSSFLVFSLAQLISCCHRHRHRKSRFSWEDYFQRPVLCLRNFVKSLFLLCRSGSRRTATCIGHRGRTRPSAWRAVRVADPNFHTTRSENGETNRDQKKNTFWQFSIGCKENVRHSTRERASGSVVNYSSRPVVAQLAPLRLLGDTEIKGCEQSAPPGNEGRR